MVAMWGFAWWIEVGRVKGILLFAKAKSSKSFYAPRARFCKFNRICVGFCDSLQSAGFARATARSNNRSNGGVAFVFVENFGIELD